jgi:phenylpropionate dioxygenase-like ring-hydroxylating dioxygenase large terminal subunit
MFLKNCWYVAAASHELEENLLGRVFLDEPVVLYRKRDGTPVALEDRCSHRFYPLSAGELKDDVIVCGYHGMEFDCTGACVRVPGQKVVPQGAEIRSYPVEERWKFVWIWMGDPALADPGLIPEIWRNDHSEWTCVSGDAIPVKGDYRLVADNLLDPSHVSFLHKSTLGTADVAEIPQDTAQEGDIVTVTRWILDSPPAPVYARLGGFTDNVDRWQIITYTPPAMVEVDMGSCIAGTGAVDGDRSQGIELHAFNLVTPSTARSSYYFWTHVRNFSLGDPEVSKTVRQQFLTAFTEDVMAIEGVQAGFDRFGDKAPVNISADGGGIRARRVLDRLIGEERNASTRQAAE